MPEPGAALPDWQPTAPEDVALLLPSVLAAATTFIRSLGQADNHLIDPSFRYAPVLLALCGMGGFAMVRGVCRALGSGTDHFPDLDAFDIPDDRELAEAIVAANRLTGIPAQWAALDWAVVRHHVVDPTETLDTPLDGSEPHPPPCLVLLCAWHILRHVRLIQVDGEWRIRVAYRGDFDEIAVPDDVHATTLSFLPARAGKGPLDRLRLVLGLTVPPPAKRGDPPHWVARVIGAALGALRIAALPRCLPTENLHDLLVPPHVALATVPVPPLEGPAMRATLGICPGYEARGLARRCGDVVHVDEAAAGALVLRHHWPIHLDSDPVELRAWRAMVPRRVASEPASAVFARYVPQCEDFRQPDAQRAIVDALFTGDLMRTWDPESPLVQSLALEFPPISIVPYDGYTTHNMAKTTVGRLWIGTILPASAGPLCPAGVMSSGSTSMPAQRTMMKPLHDYGTAFLDEHAPTNFHDHAFSDNSIQSLATGCRAHGGGKVMETVIAPRLRHSMVFSQKWVSRRPDILTRSALFFLHPLDDSTTLPEELADDLKHGRASLIMRLSHLRWMEEEGIAEELLALRAAAKPNAWRMGAHLAIAKFFLRRQGYSDEAAEAAIVAYREACQEHAAVQWAECNSSGIMAETARSDTMDLDMLFSEERDGRPQELHILDAMQRRSFAPVGSPPRVTLPDFWNAVAEARGNEYGPAKLTQVVREFGASNTKALSRRIGHAFGGLDKPWTGQHVEFRLIHDGAKNQKCMVAVPLDAPSAWPAWLSAPDDLDEFMARWWVGPAPATPFGALVLKMRQEGAA